MQTALATQPFKVIPTRYKGIEFRSRLEARWALFMDLIEVKWDYEPEGYEFPDGLRYLPDFFLPGQGCFYEIKPGWPTDQDERKAQQLAMATGVTVFLQHGPLAVPDSYPYDEEGAIMYCRCEDGQPGEDYHYIWCECPKCGVCEIQFDGRSDRNKCHRRSNCPCPVSYHGDKGYNSESPKIVRAFQIAVAERWFEV